MLLFSFRIDTIWIGIDDISVLSRPYVLFNPGNKCRFTISRKKQIETSQSEGLSDVLNIYKQTDRIVNKPTTHCFTSSVFVFIPFARSPLHLNQNFNSLFLSSVSFRTNNELPGISSSERIESHISTSVEI